MKNRFINFVLNLFTFEKKFKFNPYKFTQKTFVDPKFSIKHPDINAMHKATLRMFAVMNNMKLIIDGRRQIIIGHNKFNYVFENDKCDQEGMVVYLIQTINDQVLLFRNKTKEILVLDHEKLKTAYINRFKVFGKEEAILQYSKLFA